jgi:hypothetical protein
VASLLILLLVGAADAFHHRETQGSATLEARSDNDGPTLALADVLHIVVTVEGGKELRIEAPIHLAQGSNWELLSAAPPKTKTGEDGRVRWQQKLTLAPSAPGETKVELTPLVYCDGTAGRHAIDWKPFTVRVETQIKEIDPRRARDITATLDPSTSPEVAEWFWLWVALSALALTAVTAMLWIALRRRPRRPPASALHKAMRECDRILAMKLTEKGHVKGFVILLSGVMRRYLERRFEIPARRQTRVEVLRAIDGRNDLDDDAKRWLHTFFDQADLVKFAGTEMPPERCAELAEAVRQFCRATSSTSG